MRKIICLLVMLILIGAACEKERRVAPMDPGNQTTETNDTEDTTPPVISNIAVANVSTETVTLTWTTDDAAKYRIQYGPFIAYGLETSSTAFETNHNALITGLHRSTEYAYKIIVENEVSRPTVSIPGTFTTLKGTGGTVDISVDVASGEMTGNAYMAVWIEETATTNFIKTVFITSLGSATKFFIENLPLWKARSAENMTDAITAASVTPNAALDDISWDLRNAAGTVTAGTNYTYRVEMKEYAYIGTPKYDGRESTINTSGGMVTVSTSVVTSFSNFTGTVVTGLSGTYNP